MTRRMMTTVCAAALLATTLPLAAAETIELEEIRLWAGPAPGAKGEKQTDIPTLTIHRPPADKANGCAVIVLPGGGYWIHAIDHEGLQVAQKLNAMGVTALMCTYRLRRYGYEPKDAFVDGQRAVRFVRAHAERFGVDPDRIGVLGFSAGGHLASSLSVHWDNGDPDADDPVERASSRPDFAVLCYAVPAGVGNTRLGREFGDREINAQTPPAFIFHTSGDAGVKAKGVLDYYQKLREAGVDGELHVYGGYGPHGTGLGDGDPTIRHWPNALKRWLRKMGYFTGAERVPVKGVVTIDGEPMNRGWITLTPVKAPDKPVVGYYVHAGEDGPHGLIDIAAEHGPVPGRHRVKVHHVATALLTRPTLDRAYVYTKASPDDEKPMTVDIQPGENELRIDITTK